MKAIMCVAASAALLLCGSLSHAKTPSSSFVPRGPEPHSSLSDKHHSSKGKHSGSQGTARKGAYKTPKTAGHATHHTPPSN